MQKIKIVSIFDLDKEKYANNRKVSQWVNNEGLYEIN